MGSLPITAAWPDAAHLLEAQVKAPKVKVVATEDQGQNREGKVSVTGLEAGWDWNVGRESGENVAFHR